MDYREFMEQVKKDLPERLSGVLEGATVDTTQVDKLQEPAHLKWAAHFALHERSKSTQSPPAKESVHRAPDGVLCGLLFLLAIGVTVFCGLYDTFSHLLFSCSRAEQGSSSSVWANAFICTKSAENSSDLRP